MSDDKITVVSHYADATDAIVSHLRAESLQGGGQAVSVSLNGSQVNELRHALDHILTELRIMNLHMSMITGEEIEANDIEDIR